MPTRSRIKTEHAGAKNGGGYYGTRVEAKAESKVKRRHDDRAAVEEELDAQCDVFGCLDEEGFFDPHPVQPH